MNYRNYITIEPNKRGGKPCVRGLRITVYEVLEYLASEMTEAEILDDFPDLTREDLKACIAYAADRERRFANAKDNNLMIVSKDADMHDLSLLFGNPPKVIWLCLGNCSTLQVENLSRRNYNAINLFYEDENLSLLALS